MSALTLRDGTIVSHEVCTCFGITKETCTKQDTVNLFDMIEKMPGKPLSEPREGDLGMAYINIQRGDDGVRRITREIDTSKITKVMIPALGLEYTFDN